MRIPLKAIFLTTLNIGLTVGVVCRYHNNEEQEKNAGNEKTLNDAIDYVEENYLFPITIDRESVHSYEDLMAKLDPHSAYVADKKATEPQPIKGIGVLFKPNGDNLIIEKVYEDFPAFKAGIEPGSVVTHINGHAIDSTNITKASDLMLTGNPDEANLIVCAPGSTTAQEFHMQKTLLKPLITITRKIDSTGYIRLTEFTEDSDKKIIQSVESLGTDCDSYILDLRNNPGGSLYASIRIADNFLDSGLIISTIDRNSMTPYYAQTGDILDGKPLIVLINGGSASASETVAETLKDNKRAEVLGTVSYGKGVGQYVNEWNKGELRVTTFYMRSPSGDCVQEIGVRPTILFKGPAQEKFMRESDLKGTFTNTRSVVDPDPTKEVCEVIADAPIKKIDKKLRFPDGKPDYQLIGALEKLSGKHVYTSLTPHVPAP